MADDSDGEKKIPRQGAGLAIGLGCGIAIGTSLGVATDDMGAWTGLGISLGLIFGLALDSSFKKKREAQQDERDAGGPNEI